MPNKILQANINHSCDGHNMLLQIMAENDYTMAIVSKPYWVPDNNTNWTANDRRTVAITWRRVENPLPSMPLEKGDNFVAVRWGDMVLIGVYLSPSLDVAQFGQTLEEIERCVGRFQTGIVLVAGDFNAKTDLWGSAGTDTKGRCLRNWASATGMCCLNTGGVSTCVRVQGESIVNVSFANPAAAARDVWRVAPYESSDHRYIEIVVGDTVAQIRRRGLPRPQRWTTKKMDEDLLCASVTAGSWVRPGPVEDWDLELEAAQLQALMIWACVASMSRAVPCPRRAMPWWT
ncbi:PREDICTED: uncharacterized protein LOC108764459 [Trachymyrmex cornetzi]|uniref:uncharacterized protein LOC108764459 n=1 Tax=Trachymyrmex cornetzi TaxID=471704 RepID=UPI00084EDBD4|nr:PREDICTED: uncharacterized protein LOC108764459 [Trachymyrmex cornetzi]